MQSNFDSYVTSMHPSNSRLTCLVKLFKAQGFAPLLSAFALPTMSIGIHHGYAAGALFSVVPLNCASLFSKNNLTPFLLSLSKDQLPNLH